MVSMLVVTIRSTVVVGIPTLHPEPVDSRVKIMLDTPAMDIELASFTCRGNAERALTEAMNWIDQAFCDSRVLEKYPVRRENLEIA